MNIIITSGGTSEPIDKVRKITNNSSGKLGSIIADKFLQDKKNKIYYICDKKAIKPTLNNNLEVIEIKTTSDLKDTLKYYLEKNNIDVIIHSMVVSDYSLDYVTNDKIISSSLENKSKKEILNIFKSKDLSINTSEKISSDEDALIIKLKKNEKIISYIKKWSKKTILVGFKLLVDKNEIDLLKKAIKLMDDNNCDFVLANDLKKINEKEHIAYLINKDKKITNLKSKKEIAEKLFEILNN